MSSMLRFQIRYLKSGLLYYQGGRNRDVQPNVPTICEETNQNARNTLGFFMHQSQAALKTCCLPEGIFHHCPAHSQEHHTECGRDTLEINSPVWKRDFSTSGGMATAQLKIPARPPAKRILGTLRSLTLWQDQSRVEGKSEKKRF